MSLDFKTFNYFKFSLNDPFLELPEILRKEDHAQHANLKEDIQNINQGDLQKFVIESRIDRFINHYEDKHEGRCCTYLISKFQTEIAKDRLSAFNENTERALPYTSENLADIPMEENNLVSVKHFSPYISGFKYKDYVYQLSPMINGSNSSYWLSLAILELSFRKGLNFKIRLDPFIEVPYEEYNPMSFRMDIYGKKLDWERLKTLKEDEHGQWFDEKDNPRSTNTDYVWKPDDKEIHLTIEELPKPEDLEVRGSRYFHAIFDKETGMITHCDGAIRIYNMDEYNHRCKYHVRNAEVRKVGKRVKIFQLDEDIDKETFGLLATNFMVWNHDVLRYFN